MRGCRAWVVGMWVGVAAFGQPPELVDYQGRVAVDGNAYSGTGYFKFAISDAGNTNVWTFNGSAIGETDAPTGCVTNAVNDGVFSLMLGDTSLGMEPLTASVFSSNTRYLRVWFSTNTATPFVEMLPVQRLTAVPYALAAGGQAGSHTATANYTLNGHWLSGDGDAEGVYVDDEGNVGVGTNSPTAKLHVAGAARFEQGITFIPEMGDLSMGSFTNRVGL